ncbi:MAG: Beta-xylanase [Phenylobacterium sp.]|nr:Beta-xylanase [Phenylobacterium sp.]
MSKIISRRGLLLAAAALTAPAAAATDEAALSLAMAAKLSGRVYGAAVCADQLHGDPAFAAAVVAQCSQLTPELALKWAAIEPVRGQPSLTDMDDLAGFARTHGKTLHGHTLLWHRSIPGWAEAAISARDWEPVRRYFALVMPRYADLIHRWDVVNEPIALEDGADGLRASPFLRAFGADYVRRALETARELAPGARLMINEFGLECGDARDTARRRRLLRLVDDLRKAGAPLDGVGLQAHLDLGKPKLAPKAIELFLKELAARGLEILVTELDVKEADYTLPAERRDAAVAGIARTYLDVVLDQRAVVGVSTWGLSDRYSWLRVIPADLARWPNAWRDGSSPGLNRGLPLDAALRPKPLHKVLRAGFRRTATRPANRGARLSSDRS